MATTNQNRVTKDTSSRKNTGQSRAHAAASRAAQDAYLESTIATYEEQIQAMEVEHAETVAKLQKGREEAVEEVKQQRQAAVDIAVADLKKQKSNLQLTLDDALAANKAANQTAQNQLVQYKMDIDAQAATHNQELEAMQNRINILKDNHAKEIAKLKRQVGLEIHFQSSRRQKRTYMLRPGAKFEVAIEKLAKDINGASPWSFSGFRRHGSGGPEITNRKLTLEQLGIQNNDEIWYKV